MEKAIRSVLALSLTAIVVGCDENRRLAEQAERNTETQAQQNTEMARSNREVAEGAKRLVAADAEARRDMLSLQQGLQSERQQISAGQAALEAERQQIATQRHRDPIIAAAITGMGLVLACLLPLALSGYLLHVLYARSSEEVVSEVLLMDLASDAPRLLATAPTERQAALPAPSGAIADNDDPPPF